MQATDYKLLSDKSKSRQRFVAFSALRRLKSYLRSTMSAERLNSVCMLHVHKDRTDTVNVSDIVTEFVTAKDSRKAFFGV